MARLSRPRKGSLQYWPRSRARKFLPRVNWKTISVKDKNNLLGFITYKAAMATALVKDLTDKSMTQNKLIHIPVTILEVPSMKLLSIRFYNHGVVVKDIIVSSDKELKKKLKLPKSPQKIEAPISYEDVRAVVYSLANSTAIKKTPDISEVAISADNKFEFLKSLIGKEITIKDFANSPLVDTRGLTTGYGFTGAVRRFGITLKQHKSEKGRRRPGSLAPWHPARVTFRTPMAGQYGFFTRITNNLKLIHSGTIAEKDINREQGFKNYGKIKTSYILLGGSVQGPVKRQILITPSFRPTKKQIRKKYEFQGILA
ncbi:MAG: 50S ribosomal protein L3 [Nanoarchaeota archaeon]